MTALESQQRLFVMRGRVEKLQSDQSRLMSLPIYKRVLKYLDEEQPATPHKRNYKATVGLLETMISAQEAERQRLPSNADGQLRRFLVIAEPR
jgi:hypothetical protein